MLEAERAGAKALVVFMDQHPRNGEAWKVLRQVQNEEAHNCALIGRLLEQAGVPYSHATGGFYDKAVALEGRRERIEFLVRGLKWAVKHPRYWPLIVVFVLSIFSFLALARAMRDLPLGTSYVVWTGIGAVGAALFGMVLYQEPANPMRLTCMVLVVVGILGLKGTTPAEEDVKSLPAAPPAASPPDR